MKTLHPQIARLADRFKTRPIGPTHEFHDLRSLAGRVYLSQAEVLEQVESGSLLALSGPLNNKFMFSASALSSLRNKVIDHIANEVATEMSARGADLEKIEMALHRAIGRQFELSRGNAETVVEFARGNDDDDRHGLRNAAVAAGTAAALYGGYKYLKNRRGNGTALPPSSSVPPQLPGGPRTPRDPNSSATNVGVAGVERHPALRVPITTASPTNPDLLAGAVKRGKQAVAARGSSILRALRGAI